MAKLKRNKQGRYRFDGRSKNAASNNFMLAVIEVTFEYIIKPLANLLIYLIFKLPFKLVKGYFNK